MVHFQLKIILTKNPPLKGGEVGLAREGDVLDFQILPT